MLARSVRMAPCLVGVLNLTRVLSRRTVSLSFLGASHHQTCGLKADGLVKCWGPSTFGIQETPDDFILNRLALGWWHACGLVADSGQARCCWGGEGNSGNNDLGQSSVPYPEEVYWDLSVGQASCGFTMENKVRCWGKPNFINNNIPSMYRIADD